MLGYGAYVVFFQFCQQAFPEISDQTVARMVAGIDVIMYRPDDELKGLARLAVELGVDDLFTEGCVAADVLAALETRGEAGAQWLDAFAKARDPWFHVSSGDGFYHHHLSWNDDLTVPFTALPGYVAAVAGRRHRAAADRAAHRRAGADRHRVPRPAAAPTTRRPPSTRCSACAGWCSRSSRTTSSTASTGSPRGSSRRCKAFGALLARVGRARRGRRRVPPAPHRDRPGAGRRLPRLGGRARRRSAPGTSSRSSPSASGCSKVLKDWSPPPALGPVPEALNDPAVRMLWGITQRADRVLAEPRSRRGRRRRGLVRRGRGHRPGAVRRVARSATLREGEILVVPVTAPSWAPVFAKITGGGLRHRRLDVARGDRRPRVRDARRRRLRRRDQADQDRRPGPGRRRPRHGPGALSERAPSS